MRAYSVFEFAKNKFSKYYAPDTLVQFAINQTFNTIGIQKITEIIEPAAGDGAFMPYLDLISQKYGIPVKYFDLDPDPSNPRIKQHNFLTIELNPPFLSSRLIITGPPYGERNQPATTKLWNQFAQKASEIAGYAAFIAPPTWLGIKHPVPGLTNIYEKDMGTVMFRGSKDFGGVSHPVKTAFLIYEKVEPLKDFKEDFSKVDRDFEITVFEGYKDVRSSYWDYYVNGWGKYGVGEVSRRGISRTGTPFSRAIVIKIKNLAKKPAFDQWIKTFEENYKDKIRENTATTENIFQLKRFKKFLKEALY